MLPLFSGCSRQKGICLRIPEVLRGCDFRDLMTVSNTSREGRAVPFTEGLELPFSSFSV